MLQKDCYHESYWWVKKKRRQSLTNHCKPYFLVKPLVTYLAIDHRLSMGFPSCEAYFFSRFTNTEYTTIKQGNHERPLPARWNYRSINSKTFPFSPVYRYIHRVLLDKLWQYAKTEVKPHLSGKSRALAKTLWLWKLKKLNSFLIIAVAKVQDLK